MGISVDLEVVSTPPVAELYFWALQANFHGPAGGTGGAHLGLQWNRAHPENTAVNWGGYQASHLGGAILDGTESGLPSAPSNRNTRDYRWRAANT